MEARALLRERLRAAGKPTAAGARIRGKRLFGREEANRGGRQMGIYQQAYVQNERYFAVVAINSVTGFVFYRSYTIATGVWGAWVNTWGAFQYILGVQIVDNELYFVGLGSDASVAWFNSVNLDTGVLGGWVNLGAVAVPFRDYQVQVGGAWADPLGTQWNGRMVAAYNSTLDRYRLYYGANAGWRFPVAAVPLSGGTYTDLATGGTQYLGIASRSSPSADPTDFYWTASHQGTFGRAIGNLEVAPPVGTSRIFRLYLNGVVQAVTLTFAAGVTQVEDVVNTVNVVRGDLVCWRSTVTGVPTACDVSLAVEFVPT